MTEQESSEALSSLERRYQDLAHEHQLLTIRYVHRTLLLQIASRMLEATSYPELWKEVEEILGSLAGLPLFWVQACPESGPLSYVSTGVRELSSAPTRKQIAAALARAPVYDNNNARPYEVLVSTGNVLGCLRFPANPGGVVFLTGSDRVDLLWKTERELLEAIRSILPPAIAAVSQRQILAEAALRDPLTGVRNRREFEHRLHEELARKDRTRSELSLVMLDVDHFKVINDSYGHPEGDAVLKEIASRLVATLRLQDIVARYGGEEFAILLPECDDAHGQMVAERLRRAIADHPFPISHGQGIIDVTASLGISAARENESASELIRRVDAALYRAKGLGRDRVVAARPEHLRVVATRSEHLPPEK